jgi:hypothetical protein
MNYHYYCHFPCLEFIQLSERGEGLFLKTDYFLENYIGTDDWQCHYKRRICSYVALSKAKKRVSYGALVGLAL